MAKVLERRLTMRKFWAVMLSLSGFFTILGGALLGLSQLTDTNYYNNGLGWIYLISCPFAAAPFFALSHLLSALEENRWYLTQVMARLNEISDQQKK
jgi:hypothetical protein